MPAFAYRAATAQGDVLSGVEDAASLLALERLLASRGLYPVSVSPARERAPRRARGMGRRAAVGEAVRHLALLLDAGFPLDRSLGIAARLAPHPAVADGLGRVRERVRSGRALADALGEEPRLFPPLVVGMTRAGERGGTLAGALDRLAGHLEHEEALRAQVLSALMYPAVLVMAGGATLTVLLLYVLPKFAAMFTELGVALPASTSMLIAAGHFAGRWWPVIAAGLVASALGIGMWRRTAAGRAVCDRVLLRMPVIGSLRQRMAATRFGWALASLLESGLPILASLDVAADALVDTAVSAGVVRVRQQVRAGARLADALRRAGIFPPLFIEMVAIGEEAGRLPPMLERGARTADAELARGITRAVRLVEPALIIVFGVVVGFVALGLLQAIYGIRLDTLR